MKGDFIKMRAALVAHPKVIAMARALERDDSFRQWLHPGVMGAEMVGDDPLRCIAVSLLLRVWSTASLHGEWSGDDLLLERVTPLDLDQWGGAPGLHRAMLDVEWLRETDSGVVLPNFREMNGPVTGRERTAIWRERARARERVAPPKPAAPVAEPKVRELLELPTWMDADIRAAWDAWKEVRSKAKAPNTVRALRLALAELARLRAYGENPRAVLEQSVLRGWRGLFPVKRDALPEAKPRTAKCRYCEKDWVMTNANNVQLCREHAAMEQAGTDMKKLGDII